MLRTYTQPLWEGRALSTRVWVASKQAIGVSPVSLLIPILFIGSDRAIP